MPKRGGHLKLGALKIESGTKKGVHLKKGGVSKNGRGTTKGGHPKGEGHLKGNRAPKKGYRYTKGVRALPVGLVNGVVPAMRCRTSATS